MTVDSSATTGFFAASAAPTSGEMFSKSVFCILKIGKPLNRMVRKGASDQIVAKTNKALSAPPQVQGPLMFSKPIPIRVRIGGPGPCGGALRAYRIWFELAACPLPDRAFLIASSGSLAPFLTAL